MIERKNWINIFLLSLVSPPDVQSPFTFCTPSALITLLRNQAPFQALISVSLVMG